MEIADAIRTAVRELLGDHVDVRYFTSEALGIAVGHGEDWLEWIVTRMRKCDFALVLITANSARKPWLLWEAGAIYGIAIATGKRNLRKVRPVIYQLDDTAVPAPIRDMRGQFRRGDITNEVKLLFKEIVDQYRGLLSTDAVINLEPRLDTAIQAYMRQVRAVLIRAPLLECADRYLRIDASDLPTARSSPLLKLGFELAESTVSKYMIRRRHPPSQSWRTFLRNHAEAIAAIDLCLVPTARFESLFALVVIGHGRRQLLWFAVTRHPTAEWLAQQIIEAFPWETAPA